MKGGFGRVSTLGVALVLGLTLPALGADFYAAPNASANGTGSFSNPWRLQDALNQPSSVHPGDTIWLRGGTYSGTFVSNLNGTAASPIIVRQYAGELATLDGGSSTTCVLSTRGSYTWFWGFEVMSSDTTRQSSQPGSNPSDIHRGDAIQIWQTQTVPGLKFINLIIHDARQGFSFWQEATDAEINGCLVYYNGWNGTDRGHGHGIYTQNQTGTKHIVDNIIFENFDHGIQGYGSSSAHLINYDIHGNTFSASGEMASPPGGRNLLIGGDSTAQNISVANNFLYYQAAESPDSAFQLGYGAGCSGTTVSTNYVSNNTAFAGGCLPTSMTGNTFYGSTSGFPQSSYPNNTYTTTRPTALQVFVRPNAYEAGRANITVFNWPNQSSVSVDLTGVLAPGTGFEVRNAADFLGAPVLAGTYGGGSISLPMTGLSVAAPVGWSSPAATGPEFNVFVLLPASPGGTPTPSPSPTSTPTRTPTPVPPTATPTRTPTPAPPTPTPSPTSVPPSPTPTRTPTSTPVPPTRDGHASRPDGDAGASDRDSVTHCRAADPDAHAYTAAREPDAHAHARAPDGHAHTHAHPGSADRDAHADADPRALRAQPRGGSGHADGRDDDRVRRQRVRRPLHHDDRRGLGKGDLDGHRSGVRQLLRVGACSRPGWRPRLVLCPRQLRVGRRLRRRPGDVVLEVAVERAQWARRDRGPADPRSAHAVVVGRREHRDLPRT